MPGREIEALGRERGVACRVRQCAADRGPDSGEFLAGYGERANAQFVYGTATGVLVWDSNGAAAGGAVTLLTLNGAPALSASDIFVVA